MPRYPHFAETRSPGGMSFAASLARPLGARALRSTRSGSPIRHRSHRRAARIHAAEAEPAPTETKGRFRRRDPDAAPKPAPLGSGPDANAPPSGIKVIPVEQRSRDAFQGVAKVDGEAEDPALRSAKLAAGDALAILAFAAIGRGNHGEGMFFGDVLGTALPFLIGWFATAPLTGTFGEDARVSARRRRSFAPRPSLVVPSLTRPQSRRLLRIADLRHPVPFPIRPIAEYQDEQRRVRRGERCDRGGSRRPGASVHRQRRAAAGALCDCRHGGQRGAACGLADVVRRARCGRRRGGRE